MANWPTDVVAEITDPVYLNRTHGTPACYAKGCRGPLCQKGERDKQERRRRKQAEKDGREYVAFGPHPARHRDELLEEILDWHRTQRRQKGEVA